MADESSISIDPQELEMIVAAALGEKSLRLGEWQVIPLHGGLEVRNRLLRLSGQAHTAAGEQPWSLVLKIISGAAAGDGDPQGDHYWKREALLYQSGLLDHLPGSLVAPRCYQASQKGDEYWLWLEEIKDDLAKPWPVEHYPEVARCLGRFNGAYLTGTPMPDAPWLSRRWLRNYTQIASQNMGDLAELRKLPYFQRNFSTLDNDFLLEAWERRDEFIGAVERLPQTFCHQDAFSGNLFWRRDAAGQGQLVGLDWSFAGMAAVGEELPPLALVALFGMALQPAEAMRFYQTCLESYLGGLAEAGWKADPQLVLFSSLTTTFYRYLYGGTLGEFWSYMRDERNHPTVVAAFGVPSVDVLIYLYAAAATIYPEIYRQMSQLLEQYA